MKKLFLIIFISLSVSSCYTARGLAKQIETDPVPLSKILLTGLYENKIPGDDVNSLWNDLSLHNQEKLRDRAVGDQVYIEYVNEKEIKVELYVDNLMVDEMILKGKPKDNYFVIRKGSYFFTVILFSFKVSKKTIIGNDINSDLLLAQGISSDTMMQQSEVDDTNGTVTATYMRLGDLRPDQNTLKTE
jgi:hypothetical protein